VYGYDHDTQGDNVMSSRPLPKTLQKWAKANPDKFDEGHSELDYDSWSYWLYLKPGWINPLTETHMIHEDTVKDVLEAAKWLKPCDCQDCLERIKIRNAE
jgi:hypothetical protein